MNNDIKAFLVNIKGNEEYKAIYDYITNLQKENEKLNNVIKTIKETNHLLINQKYKLEYELDKLDELRDKAIDKLYCYGEVFDGKILQQFQKEMLDILQGENNE